MDPVKELNKVANEVKKFDEKLANEIIETSKEIKGTKKEASLINQGDRIVAVNQTSGIFKGRIYKAGEEVRPNYRVIEELDSGERVGIFRMDRFLPDWNAY